MLRSKILQVLLFGFLGLLLLNQCRVRLSSTAPDFDTHTIVQPPKLESVLNLPVNIPVSVLEKEINNQIQGLIFEDNCYDTPTQNNVKVKIWKTRDIKLQAHAEFIRFDVPLKIWAKYRWRACERCPQIERETSFNLVVSFTSRISVARDWRLQTQTLPSGFHFETRPQINFGIVAIPITSIVEPIVKEELESAAKDIDNEIAASLDFSQDINNIWRELHQPQLIDRSHNAWLKIQPVEVLLSPIRSTQENIRMTVAFRGIIEVVFGAKPEVIRTHPLPLLQTLDRPERNFNIFAASFISYDDATEIARQYLKDTIFQITNLRSVKIDDVRLMGRGNNVYTKVDLSRSIKGSVYFKGTPNYCHESQIIYLDDFDYDLRSKNVLLRSANWLMYEAFKNKIQQSFTYSIAEDIKNAKVIVDELLNDFNFDNIFKLQGRLTKIDIHSILVEPNGIRVVINAEGNTRIHIDNFNF